MGAYSSAVLADSPASFYDLDDTSGTTCVDSVGSNNMTYAGSFTLNQSGQSGQSVLFGGAGADLASIASAILSGTVSRTLEAWFYCTDLTVQNQGIINNGSPNGYTLAINGNSTTDSKISGLYGNVRWFNSGYVISANVWYHVALVINSSSKPTVYVNGVSVYSDSSTNPIAPSALCYIGNIKGRVDGAAYYNSALTAAQILTHYNAAEAYFKGAQSYPARPQGNLRLLGRPISSGLVVCFPGGQQDEKTPVNVVTGVASTDSAFGTVGYSTTLYGRTGLSTTLISSRAFTFAHTTINQNSCTYEMWFIPNTFKTTTPFISALFTNAHNVGGGLGLRLGDIGVPWDAIEFSGNTARLLPNRPHQILLSSSPSALTLYVNGIQVATSSALSSFSYSSSAILRDDSGTSRNPSGTIEQFNVWARPLSAAEAARRWADPWEIVRTGKTGLPVLARGAGTIGAVLPWWQYATQQLIGTP